MTPLTHLSPPLSLSLSPMRVCSDIAVNMFNRMFDTDGNKIVDKFEVLSVICFASGLTNTEKVRGDGALRFAY